MSDVARQTNLEQVARPQGFLRKYVFSLDHKVIGKQYYGLSLMAVVVGMFLSWLMRFHLAWPKIAVFGLDEFSPSWRARWSLLPPNIIFSLFDDHARDDHGLFCGTHRHRSHRSLRKLFFSPYKSARRKWLSRV